MDKELIAPCGMNCAICSRYLAFKHDIRKQGVNIAYCIGCRPRNRKCGILAKNCALLMAGTVNNCSECATFPCERLERLDNRYRTDFKMSMVENLRYLKKNGIDKMLKSEEAKWKCQRCGGTICCHNGLCFTCDLEKLKAKKQKYRWVD
jgi:hypothetical protein